VALHHVTQGACLLVVARAALDTNALGHGDLHVVHVVPVPDGLEDAVGEAKDEQVLHRLLTQVVVDAIDLVLAEDLQDGAVERLGRCEITPKRLLDDKAGPS